ncbi:UNVERIFIED_CONTAM: hypothetical protein FKN15_078029 [Acipenser sinensis]
MALRSESAIILCPQERAMTASQAQLSSFAVEYSGFGSLGGKHLFGNGYISYMKGNLLLLNLH